MPDMAIAGARRSTGLLLIARLVVGGIFLLAGVDKVLAPGAFADAVRAFHLLPPALVLPFAFVVPWIELLVGAYLIAGYLCRIAAAGAIALLGMFVFALITSLISGDTNHACGCFGSGGDVNGVLSFLEGGQTIGRWDPIRDLILIGMSILLFRFGPGTMSIDGLLTRRAVRPVSGVAPAPHLDI